MQAQLIIIVCNGFIIYQSLSHSYLNLCSNLIILPVSFLSEAHICVASQTSIPRRSSEDSLQRKWKAQLHSERWSSPNSRPGEHLAHFDVVVWHTNTEISLSKRNRSHTRHRLTVQVFTQLSSRDAYRLCKLLI